MATQLKNMTDLHWAHYNTVEEHLRLVNDYTGMLALYDGNLAILVREVLQPQVEFKIETPDPNVYRFNGRTMAEIRTEHTQFFYQQIVARCYESYETYLKDIHEMVCNATGSTHHQSLRHKVKGLKDDLRVQFNLLILNDPGDRQKESRIAGVRHMIIHNQGKMSAQWVGNQPDFKVKAGEPLVFTKELVKLYLATLSSWICYLDEAAIAQHNVPHTLREVMIWE